MSIAVPLPETSPATDVLVGFDGSENARLAVFWACDQANRLGSGVVVVQAVSTRGSSAHWKPALDRVDAALSRMSTQCLDLFPSVPVETALVRGGAATALARTARALESGCIVVGEDREGGQTTVNGLLHTSSATIVVARGRSFTASASPVVAVAPAAHARFVVPYALAQAALLSTPLVVLTDDRAVARHLPHGSGVVVTVRPMSPVPARQVAGACLAVVGRGPAAAPLARDAPCPVAVVPTG